MATDRSFPIRLKVIRPLNVSPCGHMRRVIVDGVGYEPGALVGKHVSLDGDETQVIEAVKISDCGPGALGLTVYSEGELCPRRSPGDPRPDHPPGGHGR